MKPSPRRYPLSRLLYLALALGALLRVGWILWALGAGVHPVSDAGWYYARAVEIATGGGYAIDGVPTAYWPVGYPGFLGLLFTLAPPSQTAAMAANVIFFCGATIATYVVARKIFASDRAAGIAALIMALSPNQIAYSSLLLSEPLFLLLMMGGIALLLHAEGRPLRLCAAGVTFGLGAFVKPQMIVIPGLCFLAGWIGSGGRFPSREAGRSIAVCYAALLVIVIPWVIRNHALFGEGLILSANDGINLFIGNNPYANGTYIVNDSLEARIYGGGDPVALNEYERNRAARDYAIGYIASHPAEALALIPRKLWYLYRADAEGFSWNMRSLPEEKGTGTLFLERMKIVAQIFYMLLGGAFIASLFVQWRRRGLAASGSLYRSVGLWVILYFTLIPLVYFGDGRFHFPVIPWMAIHAGGLAGMMRRREGLKSRVG